MTKTTDAPPPTHLAPPLTGSEADPHARRAQYHRAFLEQQLAIGARLLDLIDRETTARTEALDRARPAAEEPTSNLAVAYDRVTRAMRRTIALDRVLDEPVKTTPTRSPAQQRTDARKTIIREVEDIIHDEADDTDAKALRDELYVRLDTPDLEDDIRHRPVADIIRSICADLGLDETPGLRPSLRRTPEDIARLRARAAAPPAPPPDPPDRRPRT